MKNIILGITGSIAAYKAAEICSKLKKKDYNVTVLMSKNSLNFISPLTFQSLTGNKVYTDLFSEDNTKIDHIDLIKSSDLFVVAPATANIIAKCANGIADDFISTSFLVFDINKVIFAPAMNTKMYNNRITQENIKKLKDYGAYFINPDSGILACGDEGVGKLADIDKIIDEIEYKLNKSNELKDLNILISAGSTSEPIDLVRNITNKSSGKMGFALAKVAIYRGAKVHLISSKNNLKIPTHLESYTEANTCDEFFNSIDKVKDEMDVIIMCAAISDFKVKNIDKSKKLKKNELTNLKIDLELNKDILNYLGKIENKKYKLVGFAAESNNLKENAISKLKNKNLDYIILNNISNKTIGFNSDYNKVTIYNKNMEEFVLELDSKENIAKKIFDVLELH